jgi:hypothetical protein
MQSRAIIRIAAVALAASVVSACDRASSDVGADLAACMLEEGRTDYGDKRSNKAVLVESVDRGDEGRRALYSGILRTDAKMYYSTCMRSRGWQLKAEDRCSDFLLEMSADRVNDADKPYCYEPATSAGDGIVK